MSDLLNKKGFILDLDGCIYRGNEIIDGAKESIKFLRDQNKRILFLTNNSTKTPEYYANKLESMGIHTFPSEILTSSLATAQYLKGLKIESCYMIGEEGLQSALKEQGIEIYDDKRAAFADCVVCGLDMSVTYSKLAAACQGIQRGAKYFATNADPRLPIEEGYLPGAGSIVKAIATATGVSPIVIGKPSKKIMNVALRILGTRASETAIIGDTLDFDIRAGINMGSYTVLVLTGANSIEDIKKSPFKPNLVMESIANLPSF